MIYSKTCEYAIRALLYFASQKRGIYVLTRTVSRETGISITYLAKIFQELTRYGILDSRRGATGGFSLKKDPATISLYSLVEMIDDPEQFKACVMGLDRCSDVNACPLHDVWKASRQKILREMQNCSILSITKKVGKARYRGMKRGRLNLGLGLSGSTAPAKLK